MSTNFQISNIYLFVYTIAIVNENILIIMLYLKYKTKHNIKKKKLFILRILGDCVFCIIFNFVYFEIKYSTLYKL